MKKADNFDAGKWLVENKLTTQSNLNEEKPTNDMVKDYWRIMVKNQPEDVINILVGLTFMVTYHLKNLVLYSK
jgi:hypothetical protein